MHSRLVASEFGVATHHSRVESWECDLNQHWNARFYHRSFQMAAERIETLCGRPNRGTLAVAHRVVRFHRELFVGTSVEVRSARIGGGEHEGCVLHVLSGDGKTAATALDRPRRPALVLPQVDPDAFGWALPRTMNAAEVAWSPDDPNAAMSETGPVRRAELDEHGVLFVDEIVRRAAIGVHHQLSRLGFTAEFTQATAISRMSVELAVTPLRACDPGVPLIVRSGLSYVRDKAFSTFHLVVTPDGTLVARTANTVVPVDLKTRRAVPVPEFIRRVTP